MGLQTSGSAMESRGRRIVKMHLEKDQNLTVSCKYYNMFLGVYIEVVTAIIVEEEKRV